MFFDLIRTKLTRLE